MLGNSRLPHRGVRLSFAEGLGWLAQIGLFVMLGLYVARPGSPSVVPALIPGLVLLLVARPLRSIAAAAPFGVPWREQAFLSWSGLRGAVPIVLAMIPLSSGCDERAAAARRVFVVVVVLTLLQGTTLPWVARRLGVIGGPAQEIQLEAAPLEEMNAQVLQITSRRVPDARRLRLPAAAAGGADDRAWSCATGSR